jgi:hypothetical protein
LLPSEVLADEAVWEVAAKGVENVAAIGAVVLGTAVAEPPVRVRRLVRESVEGGVLAPRALPDENAATPILTVVGKDRTEDVPQEGRGV